MTTEESSAPPMMEPRFVDKGLRAPARCPNDPQAYLQRSNHPYAPFPGNALTWESYVYDDGTTYEGLCREEVPHGKGALVVGNGSGGGFQTAKKGDCYEGEFQGGFAHGLGQYISFEDEEVYRGEFYAGKRQGCGMLLDIGPYLDLLEDEEDAHDAWEASKDEIYSNAKLGTWRKDYFVADPDPKGQRYCHVNEIKGTLEEIDSLLTHVRMFKWKPDGEVTFLFAQDGNGMPLNLMQDPLHYPYGTKFMAPGPLGQCHDVPEDEELYKTMSLHAENYRKIHDMYNLDYDPKPGSTLYKALEYHNKNLNKKKLLARKKAESTVSAQRMKKQGSEKKKATDKPAASITMSFTRGLEGIVRRVGEIGLNHGFTRPRLARPKGLFAQDSIEN
eukprot:g998.t1